MPLGASVEPQVWRPRPPEAIPLTNRTLGDNSNDQELVDQPLRPAARARGGQSLRVETVVTEALVVTAAPMMDLPMEMNLVTREVDTGVRTGQGTSEGSLGTRCWRRSRGSLRCRQRL